VLTFDDLFPVPLMFVAAVVTLKKKYNIMVTKIQSAKNNYTLTVK